MDRINRVQRLTPVVQRAWASTSKCNARGECGEAPTHKVFIRQSNGMRTFKLACDAHAAEVAKAAGLTVEEPRD